MTRTIRAAMVIARRDFVAILFSRSFLFFLIGPLFPIIVGGLAGGIGASVNQSMDRPELGIAMSAQDIAAMTEAAERMSGHVPGLPRWKVAATLEPGEPYDAERQIASGKDNLGAVLTGSLDAPSLVGSQSYVDRWLGPVELILAEARRSEPTAFPPVAVRRIETSRADENSRRVTTAQAAQTVLFLLTMLLAGMVLSNLVEEKANKIIEVLAAAVPMDAVFFGKLLAMLGISFVGISVWAAVGLLIFVGGGASLPVLVAPAVGWPMFLALGVVYFAFAYLLLGSLFLSIGGLASTVREVQTLSFPVTMMQLLVFFFASYAIAHVGEPIEIAALLFPLSSPFAMQARAALEPDLLPHLVAIGWQSMWVAIIIRVGSRIFRRTVMKSGPRKGPRRSLFARIRAA